MLGAQGSTPRGGDPTGPLVLENRCPSLVEGLCRVVVGQVLAHGLCPMRRLGSEDEMPVALALLWRRHPLLHPVGVS